MAYILEYSFLKDRTCLYTWKPFLCGLLFVAEQKELHPKVQVYLQTRPSLRPIKVDYTWAGYEMPRVSSYSLSNSQCLTFALLIVIPWGGNTNILLITGILLLT